MNLDPQPMPKMGEYDRCRSCGRCILGCPHGVKWDSRRFLQVALDNGAQLVTGCRVESVVIEGGQVTGVQAQKGWTRRFYPADLVVLAAGGFATPVILQNSGIDCEPNLFVDPVLCVAAEWPDSLQCREIPMPFVMQREHFILSPYFDYVSYLFNRAWSYRAKDLLGIMIKLADSNSGALSGGQITKSLTGLDRQRLDEGVGHLHRDPRAIQSAQEPDLAGHAQCGASGRNATPDQAGGHDIAPCPAASEPIRCRRHTAAQFPRRPTDPDHRCARQASQQNVHSAFAFPHSMV
jgi:ferredoxin